MSSDEALAYIIKNRREEFEIQMLNGYRPKRCPHCKESTIWQYGKTKSGLQRYRCGSCQKTFTPLTGTPFEGHRDLLVDWLTYSVNVGCCGLMDDAECLKLYKQSPAWWTLLLRVVGAYRMNTIFLEQLAFRKIEYSWETQSTSSAGKEGRERHHAHIELGIGRTARGTSLVLHFDGAEAPKPESILAAFKDNIKEKTVFLCREEDVSLYRMLIKALNLDGRIYRESNPSHKAGINTFDVILQDMQGILFEFLDCHRKWFFQNVQGVLDMFSFFVLHSNTEKLSQFKILRDIVLDLDDIEIGSRS